MKTLITLALLAIATLTQAATIPITNDVVYPVADVRLSPVNVHLQGTNLQFSMVSTWLDAAGKPLKPSEMKRYSEPQVAAMFKAVGQPWTPFASAFRALLPPEGANPQTILDHDGTNLTVRVGSAKLDPADGRLKWRAVLLDKAVVDAKLLTPSGVTANQIWAALQGVVRKELE